MNTLGFQILTAPLAVGLTLAFMAPRASEARPVRAEAVKINAAATATRVLTASDLIGGPASTAKVQQGDILLQNDLIRVIIRGPGRTVSAAMFGGHIIDADIQRPGSAEGRDQFGQVSTFFNLAHSMNAETVEPISSGLDAGHAGVRACGDADLFDFVDLQNALALVPGALAVIPFNFDLPLPVRVCNTYTLGPDDRHVTIITDLDSQTSEDLSLMVGDVIDGGSDVEYWLKNEAGESYGLVSPRWTWGGFGPQPFGYLELMGFAGDGVSYGYAAPLKNGEADAMAVAIAGVTVTAIGSTSLLGTMRASRKEGFRLPGNSTRSYTRHFIVGEDLAEVTAEAYRIEAIATEPISGTVIDGTTGEPLAGARVTALKGGAESKPVTQFVTDDDGTFSGELPPATYGLIAAHGVDRFHLEREPMTTPVMVTVPQSGGATATVELGPTSTLAVTVLDGNALGETRSLPARIGFYDPSFQPPGGGGVVPEQARDPVSLIMDTTYDEMRPGLVKEVVVTHSPATIPIPPGTWDIVITRGPEYNRFETRKTFTAGREVELSATLTQVVDTEGYLSADLHVHAMNSPDSPVDNGLRVKTFAADGVDLLVSTDHDFITDFQPLINSLGLDDRMTSLPGLELSTFAVGHFNAFPLPYDDSHRLGGALDWADGDYVCDVGQAGGLPSQFDNLSPVQFLDALDTCYEGGQVRQLNHVRGELQGYFSSIGLDLSALGTEAETQADPRAFRMAEGLDLFEPTSFEAFEVLNEYGFRFVPTLLSDAFALFNLGYPKALTAVSDTHYTSHVPAGNSRTWLKMDIDDPAALNQDPSFADDFLESLRGMHATGSSGPFVTAEITRVGASSGAQMGETLTATSGSVNLKIRIQQPRWMNFKTVGVFINTPVQAQWEAEAIQNMADLDPELVWSLPDPDFTPDDVFVQTNDPAGASRQEFTHTERLELSEDSWVVVALWGGSVNMNADTDDVWDTLAFTSPIFVDVDGNGRFDAPCGPDVYEPGQGCDYVAPPPGDWGDRKMDVNSHNQWVYDLAELIQLEASGSIPTR